MEIERARNLVCEMLDILNRVEDGYFVKTSSGIYNDLNAAKSMEFIIDCARELMIFVDEINWTDCEMIDHREEIESIFNQLLEESEEF